MTDDKTTGRTLSEVIEGLPEERRKVVEFRWHYLCMQEALRGDWIRKTDYDAKVQECEAMRHDLSILRQHHHEGCMAEIDRLRGLLAAANERAGKLNRQLVELQDAIDSRDKALGFTEITPD